MYYSNQYLSHHGVLGMKWGVRRYQNKDGSLTSAGRKRYRKGESMRTNDPGDSSVTRKVKADYNSMTDSEFLRKYKVSKSTYLKRVNKYGDPTNSKKAQVGKKLQSLSGEISKRKIEKMEKDLRSFDSIKDGVKDEKGRDILTKKDVSDIVKTHKQRILKEISEYERKTGEKFLDDFLANYDDLEMWDLYSPEELKVKR